MVFVGWVIWVLASLVNAFILAMLIERKLWVLLTYESVWYVCGQVANVLIIGKQYDPYWYNVWDLVDSIFIIGFALLVARYCEVCSFVPFLYTFRVYFLCFEYYWSLKTGFCSSDCDSGFANLFTYFRNAYGLFVACVLLHCLHQKHIKPQLRISEVRP